MNYFFGFKNDVFFSKLTIPRFQNSGLKNLDYEVFEAEPVLNKWSIKKATYIKTDEFFYIENSNLDNNKLFFLSSKNEVEKFFNGNFLSLVNLNSFTDTSPTAFRSNFKIYLKDGGFSSYQSEYPHDMTLKKGNIFSSISTLLNSKADENFILIRNIFYKPIQEKFKIYFINLKNKKILKTEIIYSNKSNLIYVEKNLLNEEVYIFSDYHIGIPIFISKKKNHLSMEHTHPPHHYILSEDRFKIISQIKNEIKQHII